MTKNGVRIALGYPAAHRTPSLENNSWIYWHNRFGTKVIEFDRKGNDAEATLSVLDPLIEKKRRIYW